MTMHLCHCGRVHENTINCPVRSRFVPRFSTLIPLSIHHELCDRCMLETALFVRSDLPGVLVEDGSLRPPRLCVACDERIGALGMEDE